MKMLAFVTLALVATACQKNDKQAEPASSTTLTALDVVNNDNAVIRLANVRCDREYNCNRVGAGQTYQDQNACLREIHHDTQGVLRVDQCPGVDQAKLATCLADIQATPCRSKLASTEDIASCRKRELCVGR